MPGREDDHNWPEPDRVGRQELEVKLGKEHISFTVRRSVFGGGLLAWSARARFPNEAQVLRARAVSSFYRES